MAILRWTSTNPGGGDEHYAIAHYGTDLHNLDETAKSHIRLNRNPPPDDLSGTAGWAEAEDDLLLLGNFDGIEWND